MSTYLISRGALGLSIAALFAAGALAIATPVSAQSASPSLTENPSCFLAPAKLSDHAISLFKSNPASLLADYPQGGNPLMAAVRTLAGSDVSTVDLLIELAKSAPFEAKAAIAAGLANAASSCVRTRPDIAGFIQEKIAGSEDAELITAFISASGAIDVAAFGVGTGAAGGGAAAIGGSQTGPGGIGPRVVPQFGGLGGFARRGGGGFTIFINEDESGGSVSPSRR